MDKNIQSKGEGGSNTGSIDVIYIIIVMFWTHHSSRIVQDLEEIINPEILSRSPKSTLTYEVCMSLPGIVGPVERANEIEVEYLRGDGERKAAVLSGPVAAVFQVNYINCVH